MEKINVKNLVLGDVGTTENYLVESPFDEMDLPPELKVERVKGKIKAIRLEESVIVIGAFEAEAKMFCDRCLDGYKSKLTFELEREYEIDRTATSEENLFVDKYFNIDFTEPLREELIIAVPMKKICKEKCKGICPSCGQNLNKKDCNCK